MNYLTLKCIMYLFVCLFMHAVKKVGKASQNLNPYYYWALLGETKSVA